ncbi:MAG: undecaprenyl-diphosphate phosphatase [Candidatus Omnitrophica bacterium]|nr:undecaprenyl-diphosphate phosphatase [Candidatus Omnitrophota bacterium]
MTIVEAAISGVAQGITEFLPVSSSGHLAFLNKLFGLDGASSIFFDVLLHGATLGAVVLYFFKDIIKILKDRDVKLIGYLVIATIPAVIAALFFEDRIEGFFADIRLVAVMIIITGVIVFTGQVFLWRGKNQKEMSFASAIVIGLAQSVALLPGISRSGATISTGLASGVRIKEVFRFSFLLSIPAILGANLFEIIKAVKAGSVLQVDLLSCALGVISAFVTGLLSLRFLWWLMEYKRLYIVAVYCVALGSVCLFFMK